MIQTEERRQAVFRDGGLSVDGVVRVRRFRAGRRASQVLVERRVPVAVVVSRDGREERIALPAAAAPRLLIALFAIPIAARLAARLLSHRQEGQ